ncbi:hypothetical protein FPSE_07531 [Fusarium pseudograminearum CS3096]|uniref:Zn(2)-C6 fungal-type domain-containing protein n=1 Tax=Fusarium pseudograminearum (strain CS3096) TaxID=1028729 RepID=K3VDZ3_FUSPC|nr:hypothetical protein FPSE_07531 [Fusarium pseudograminearum CS3096]EKJ72302.1 hypothetical protein FPSE_07531 [Fusarium pseudograminearum CS3096]KAF0639760.1 hypothetical protein FPSE5266_07531 [Fusarium pseudograminearum]
MLKRRSACERCRGQKLKCIREPENRTDSCLRCTQAREECVVNLRKTPGRPSGRTNSSSRRSPPNNTTPPTQTPTPAPTLVLDDSDSISAPRNGSFASSSEDALEGLLDMNIDWGDMNMFLLNGNGTDQVPEIPSSLFSYAESTRVEPPPPCASWSASGDFAAPTGLFPCQIRNEVCDPGIQLSGLQQSLSKHLVQLQSFSWDITSVLKLESASFGFQTPESLCETSRSFNPLVGTFEIISDFEHVLELLKNAVKRRERQEVPTLPKEMLICYSLTAISCYLQLVCVYNNLFSYVLDQASSNPAVRTFILDSTPGISLSGFVIPSPKNIVGRSFAQLMQHKIGSVEAALGLPDDWRISKDPSSHQSADRPLLLGGKEGQALLELLMGQAVEGESLSSAMGLLESVREKITEIECLA